MKPYQRLERTKQPIMTQEEINAVIVITAVCVVILAYVTFSFMMVDVRLTGF